MKVLYLSEDEKKGILELGIMEGMAEGRAEGIKKTKLDIIRRMIANYYPLDIISNITTMSIDEILKIKDNIIS